MKLATAIVFVGDVATMKAFYGGVLGLEVVEERDGWVRLDAGGSSVALHALRGAAADDAAREDAYVKLAFHTEDVDAERDRLVAAGARMGEIARFGSIALCDGVDPDGNVFQISSRPRRPGATVIPTHRCADVERAIAFYTGVLGASLSWRDRTEPGPAFASVRWRGSEIFLSSHGGDGAFGAATSIRVDDVDAVFADLQARGYQPPTDRGPVFESPTDQSWGTRELYVSDPDGNTLRFTAWRR